MSEEKFYDLALLHEEVHPDELQELLSRLASTDTLFKEPIPTIRDVAEATDASPLLIGRILTQLRGASDVSLLKNRMAGFEARLQELEKATKAKESLATKSRIDPIAQILRDSGAAKFTPLSNTWLVTPSDQPESEFDLQKWSKVKGWYETDQIYFEDSFVTSVVHPEVKPTEDGREVRVAIIVSLLILFLVLVIAPNCNTTYRPSPPNDSYGRPVSSGYEPIRR